jgi:hypothetical protein
MMKVPLHPDDGTDLGRSVLGQCLYRLVKDVLYLVQDEASIGSKANARKRVILHAK